MWTFKELKEHAKTNLSRHYWKCVLVALILGICAGGSSGSAGSSRSISEAVDKLGETRNLYDHDYNFDDFDFDDDFDYDYDNYDDDDIQLYDMSYKPAASQVAKSRLSSDTTKKVVAILAVFFVVFLIIWIFVMLLKVFLFNALEVGCQKFYVSTDDDDPSLNDLGFAFSGNNYKPVIRTMFLRDLYAGLWTLLFIIPGIIKSYEYMMIPYLLGDHPDWDNEMLFDASRKMMDGNKMNAFLLNLSFIGWRLLAVLTLGLLNLFYVSPYQYLTNAMLYKKLLEYYPEFKPEDDYYEMPVQDNSYQTNNYQEENTSYGYEENV